MYPAIFLDVLDHRGAVSDEPDPPEHAGRGVSAGIQSVRRRVVDGEHEAQGIAQDPAVLVGQIEPHQPYALGCEVRGRLGREAHGPPLSHIARRSLPCEVQRVQELVLCTGNVRLEAHLGHKERPRGNTRNVYIYI